MKTRIITGIAGGAVLLGALWWQESLWRLFVCLLALLALAEIAKMSEIGSFHPVILTGYMLAAALIIADLPFSFILPFGFVIAVFLSLRDQQKLHTEKVGLYVMALVYVLFGFNLSVDFYESYGKLFLLYVFALIWASDTFAYFTGYFIGKHKMAPVLSPKKTYEGLVGGIIGTVAVAYFLNDGLVIGYNTTEAILFGLFIACLAPIGDLFESAIKRHYGIKDSGRILPGHGGILDRFDSFLFVMIALPVYFYLFS